MSEVSSCIKGLMIRNDPDIRVSACPFCVQGITALRLVREDLGDQGLGAFCIECAYCGCQGPQGTTQEQAVQRWNTRK